MQGSIERGDAISKMECMKYEVKKIMTLFVNSWSLQAAFMHVPI